MEWIRGRIIGRGTSATVSLATTATSGEVFAVKSAELSKSSLLQRESEILSSLNSSYIVGYRSCEINKEPSGESTYNLLMEYAPNGSLADLVRRSGHRLEEPEIVEYTRQILLGLEYLHSNRIAHCDIKGSNILVGEKGGAKIADFGCAKRVGDPGSYPDEPIRGTPAFMAPEVARGEEQGFESDVWALGCTVIEMATGSPPWVNDEPNDPVRVLYRVGFSGGTPEAPCCLSDRAKDFLEKCLRRDPKERWTANQLTKHPFTVEFNDYENKLKIENLNSPTSVVDQRFWNSMEGESECLEILVRPICCGSVLEKIGRLGSISGGPTWQPDEESWVTVREGLVYYSYTCSL